MTFPELQFHTPCAVAELDVPNVVALFPHQPRASGPTSRARRKRERKTARQGFIESQRDREFLKTAGYSGESLMAE